MKHLVVALALAALAGSAPGASAHAAASPCRAGQLRAKFFVQAATRNLFGGVYVRNVSRRTCALIGQPYVLLLGGGAGRTEWRTHAVRPLGHEGVGHRPTSSLRAFRRGSRALLRIHWSNWCGPGSSPAGRPGKPPRVLAIGLPGGGLLRWRLAGATPRCEAPGRPSYVRISRFVPA